MPVTQTDDLQRRRYMKALLGDVHAFERMLTEGRFETGIRRIGAEQEMFLVDRRMDPAPVAVEVMEALGNPPNYSYELARFNLEANAAPRLFGGRCLSEMEAELLQLVRAADDAAQRSGARVLLTGILPTLRKGHLGLENMVPKQRYRDIDAATTQAVGGTFHVRIDGLDELDTTHDNVMLESCNTSFQLHFQVAPAEFAKLYNMAQAITAPVLAAGVNSPLLLGKQLWKETRIALFQSSVDARSGSEKARNFPARVSFGERWVRESAAEVYRDSISRYRVLFVGEPDEEDPMAVLDKGGVPKLTSLRLHNGTVYRWNRLCYGCDGGPPHLRIENRVLPAGPTIVDQVANAAFYFGLMSGCLEEYGAIHERMDFEDAKGNFLAAARQGLAAQFSWVDGEMIAANRLILDRLLPLARAGLVRSAIDAGDIERYLGILEARVRAARTGAAWTSLSLRALGDKTKPDVAHRTLVAATLARQAENQPVHTWELARPDERAEVHEWRETYRTVGQFMTTKVFSVRPDDLVDLAASLMEWEHLRHVPVEDERGRVVGILTHRALLRYIARGRDRKGGDPVPVSDLMKPDPVTIGPDTPTLEAIALMRSARVSCLPVVDDGKLVGIITESDLIAVAARLLDEHLRGA